MAISAHVVSSGTLRDQDLVKAFWPYVREYLPDAAKDIQKAFGPELDALLSGDEDKIDALDRDRVAYLLNEDIFDAMMEMAPEGLHFGASEGDGACFGFWQNPAEEQTSSKDVSEFLQDYADVDAFTIESTLPLFSGRVFKVTIEEL